MDRPKRGGRMKKTITKKQILKAIDTENLYPGTWFEKTHKNYKDCQVCAVGSVLRNSIGKEAFLNRVNSTSSEMADIC
jgi:hypothetical protein